MKQLRKSVSGVTEAGADLSARVLEGTETMALLLHEPQPRSDEHSEN
jgi:hypothetical protein